MPAATKPGLKVLVFLYTRDPDRVLLLRRVGDLSDRWHPVTGHGEKGDKGAEQAALREVEEETGLRLDLVEDLHEVYQFSQERDGKERTYEEHAFAADVTGAGAVKLSPEHAAFSWFSFRNAVAALHYPHQRRVLEELLARLRSPPPAETPPEPEQG